MTRHDFYSTMDLFNEAVRQHPPPGHKAIWLITLLTVWILAGTTAYIVWVYGHQSPYILLIVPFVMLLTTIIWLWRYRYLQSIVSRGDHLLLLSPLFEQDLNKDLLVFCPCSFRALSPNYAAGSMPLKTFAG